MNYIAIKRKLRKTQLTKSSQMASPLLPPTSKEDDIAQVHTKDPTKELSAHFTTYPKPILKNHVEEYIKLRQQEEAKQPAPNLPSLNFSQLENWATIPHNIT